MSEVAPSDAMAVLLLSDVRSHRQLQLGPQMMRGGSAALLSEEQLRDLKRSQCDGL